jgi:hypothetical protein
MQHATDTSDGRQLHLDKSIALRQQRGVQHLLNASDFAPSAAQEVLGTRCY